MSPTRDLASPLNIGSEFSIASFASTKPVRGIAAAPASGWIAKWAVDVHGGKISVEAGADRGSVFRIVLPVDPTPTANAANMTLAGRGDR